MAMMILDVFYVALATIAVMVLLQFVTFVATKMMYPPEPKIIYRDVHVPMQAPPVIQPPQQQPIQNGPTFIQAPQQQVELPEYEPRKPASDSLRVDPELPIGIQETRPPGT